MKKEGELPLHKKSHSKAFFFAPREKERDSERRPEGAHIYTHARAAVCAPLYLFLHMHTAAVDFFRQGKTAKNKYRIDKSENHDL